mgnify:CR=1 FL=1
MMFFKARVALHALLEAAGIGAGDQVLLPGYTCVVVPNAVLYRGAEPIYIDIDPRTFNIDITLLEKEAGIRWDPSRARAIIAQHTYGLPADMTSLRRIADRYGLLLIEDACHCLGSTIEGMPVGSHGDATFFSSQWSKPITTGLGGWAVVRNQALASELESVTRSYKRPSLFESIQLQLQYLAYRVLYRPRLFWQIQAAYRSLGRLGLAIGSSSGVELDCRIPSDYCKLMGSIQESTLRRNLARADRDIAARRRNAQLIETMLETRGLSRMTVPTGMDPVWLRYPVRVGNKTELLHAARKNRIELGDWFRSPVHPNDSAWDLAGYTAGDCPAAEAAAREVVNLPTHPRLSENEITRIVAFISDHGMNPDIGTASPTPRAVEQNDMSPMP